ncbi:MAG TPA: elongation factor G [bacterium]|nr:elongation factor G [bacterium]HPQ18256.1 elongation factor G [bacterium]
MKNYSSDKIKNVAMISHQNAGKTTIVETMLFNIGAISRVGSVDNGTSQVDYYPLEIEKKFTITSKVIPIEWKENKINVIDTPGYPDFIGEVPAALSVCEGAIIVIDATTGVQVNTDKVWRYSDKYNLPKIIFINKMDKEYASFEKSIDTLKKLSTKVVALQIPIGEGPKFSGIIDILNEKAYLAGNDNKGPTKEGQIPDEYKEKLKKAKVELIEKIVETDEILMEKYFAEAELTKEELIEAIYKATKSGQIIPVLCGSALNNVGINILLDKIIDYIPSSSDLKEIKLTDLNTKSETTRKRSIDEKFTGFVFKTTIEEHIGEIVFVKVYSGIAERGMDFYNPRSQIKERIGQIVIFQGKNKIEMNNIVAGDIGALVKLKDTTTCDTICNIGSAVSVPPIEFPEPVISLAVIPKTKKDQEKMSQGLTAFMLEDPTFKVSIIKEFGETIISGMGEMHLEIMLKKLKSKYDVEVETAQPKIAYRETIRKTSKGEGKYKKQSGGRGQYGHCFIEIKPRTEDLEVTFENAIFGGAIPAKYVPAVEKGIRNTLAKGIIAGYPAVGIDIKLYDGTYHEVDSSDMAFQIAGSFAIKKAFETAGATILEPILEIEVKVADNYVGDVVGDLNSRRGKILGMEPQGAFTVIKAQVPESEMYKYATSLRSLTQGTGDFTQKFSHYEIAPQETIIKLTEEYKKHVEEGRE